MRNYLFITLNNMQYLCYIEKINPSVRIKLEYAGTLDVKLVAAISFIFSK